MRWIYHEPLDIERRQTGTNMKKNLLIFLIPLLLSMQLFAVEAKSGPMIHIDPIEHTFPVVFEGEALSHEFKVMNKGTADLEIKDVTHQ